MRFPFTRAARAPRRPRRPAPARAVPRPARAGRVPGRHGPGADRRDRRQRRRRHHDLQRDGRPDRADAAVDLPDHDRHPGHRPGDGRAARRGHRAGPVGPHPRPVRGAPDGVRDGHPAHRQRRQHRRRVLRRGGRARDLRDLALPRRADRRGRHLGAGHQGQLPDRRARLPVGHRRVLRLHRVGDPGRPRLGRGRAGARDAVARPRARPSCCCSSRSSARRSRRTCSST